MRELFMVFLDCWQESFGIGKRSAFKGNKYSTFRSKPERRTL